LDSTFDPGLGPDGTVRNISVQPDGAVLIGGWFNYVAGQSNPRLARLNPDGSLDTAFSAAAVATDYADIGATAVAPDGKILVAGYLPTDFAQGTTQFQVVRLNPDGTLDTTFKTGSGFDVVQFGRGIGSMTPALRITSTGKLLV